jgi:hypothetical protein
LFEGSQLAFGGLSKRITFPSTVSVGIKGSRRLAILLVCCCFTDIDDIVISFAILAVQEENAKK